MQQTSQSKYGGWEEEKRPKERKKSRTESANNDHRISMGKPTKQEGITHPHKQACRNRCRLRQNEQIQEIRSDGQLRKGKKRGSVRLGDTHT